VKPLVWTQPTLDMARLKDFCLNLVIVCSWHRKFMQLCTYNIISFLGPIKPLVQFHSNLCSDSTFSVKPSLPKSRLEGDKLPPPNCRTVSNAIAHKFAPPWVLQSRTWCSQSHRARWPPSWAPEALTWNELNVTVGGFWWTVAETGFVSRRPP
jgi:hypothetical protein